MEIEGVTPDLPVCAVSAIVFDASEQHVLLGARRETPNEKRHLYTLSTTTRQVARGIFNVLAAGNPAEWQVGTEAFTPAPGSQLSIGRGEHGTSADVFAVETALGKIGITGAITDGSITGSLTPVRRSLTRVADKDTGKAEWTAMLHYAVRLSPDSDLSAIPPNTPAYEPIAWVPAGKVTQAYDRHDVGVFDMPVLNELFLCIDGACMAGAAELLRLQARDDSGTQKDPLR